MKVWNLQRPKKTTGVAEAKEVGDRGEDWDEVGRETAKMEPHQLVMVAKEVEEGVVVLIPQQGLMLKLRQQKKW